MKRIIVYFLILAAALLTPSQGTDVGKLRPVEVVLVCKDADVVTIETDTKDLGIGKTVGEALQNMKETTAGIIYLDTADYLLVQAGSKELIGEIGRYLSEDVRVCETEGRIDLTAAAEFLAVHRPKLRLKDWKGAGSLQTLTPEGERLVLK